MTGPAKAAVFVLALAGPVAGCDQNMISQPKYEEYETSELFPDGMVNQEPVEGTVARGDIRYRQALDERPRLTRELLERGRQRFAIYCSPCHGPLGDGKGMIVQRGFPQPPSFHSERLRQSSARHIVEIITNGKGDMFSYSARVAPADRWAIAAYVKALQLSQAYPAERLPPELRAKLADPDAGPAP